jgi:hypothetical protein
VNKSSKRSLYLDVSDDNDACGIGSKRPAEYKTVTALTKIAADNDSETSIFWSLGSEDKSTDPIILDFEHRQNSDKLVDELCYCNKIGNATFVVFA